MEAQLRALEVHVRQAEDEKARAREELSTAHVKVSTHVQKERALKERETRLKQRLQDLEDENKVRSCWLLGVHVVNRPRSKLNAEVAATICVTSERHRTTASSMLAEAYFGISKSSR